MFSSPPPIAHFLLGLVILSLKEMWKSHRQNPPTSEMAGAEGLYCIQENSHFVYKIDPHRLAGTKHPAKSFCATEQKQWGHTRRSPVPVRSASFHRKMTALLQSGQISTVHVCKTYGSVFNWQPKGVTSGVWQGMWSRSLCHAVSIKNPAEKNKTDERLPKGHVLHPSFYKD